MIDNIKLNKAMKIPFNSILRGNIAIPKMLRADYLHVNDNTIVYHNNYKNYNKMQLKSFPKKESIDPKKDDFMFASMESLSPIR